VPSAIGEDEVKICVVVKPDTAVTPEELIAHCVESMPRFMVPRYVEVLEALPKNAIGRVQKHVLRATPMTPTTWDREGGA
jgi:crotonobetaine/carnitine-CoA ligase